MENQFFVDSKRLSDKALEKKHRLETDPSYRTSHMEYMAGMEKIESDICANVMGHMNSYDYTKYTAKDVRAALDRETCTIEDFKALLSPAAEPFLEEMAERARRETSKHFGNTVYLFTPLYIANYCENYCVYCGFNCYNDIKRMKLILFCSAILILLFYSRFDFADQAVNCCARTHLRGLVLTISPLLFIFSLSKFNSQ